MTHLSASPALPLTALALLAACSGGSTAPSGSADGQVAAATDTEVATTRPAPVDPMPTPASGPANAGAQPAATPAPPTPTTLARIPARFVGTWAPDTRACTANYDYQPAFQRIVIKPDQVGFFETAGEVQNVVEAGGSTRITLRERVGDSYPVYPIMISLADGGRALNYIRDGERKVYVKCAG